MRSERFVTVLLIAAALFSCRGRETALTGGYGSALVTGQVIMAGELAGSSPAGVDVSVVGTGMMTTLDAEGRFAFMGVPENAKMTFRRASDGIDTTLELDRPATGLVIQLSAGSAKAGRGRGSRAGKQEYEGVIRSIAADKSSLVLYTSHKEEVTIAIDEFTIIRKGETLLTPADLQTDYRVHIRATLKEGVLTALEVKVQNTGDRGRDDSVITANGLVTEVGVDHLKVLSQPRGEVTVYVDASTIIRKQGVLIGLSDIQVGWEVNTLSVRVDGKLVAKQIEVRGNSGGQNQQYEGVIRHVSADSLTVYTSRKQYVTFVLEASTIIIDGQTRITVADLHVDDRVHVKAMIRNGVLVALEVKLQNDEGGTISANGRVTEVGADFLKVLSEPRGEVTVYVDANTVIKQQGVLIQLSDIKVGWEVNTKSERVGDRLIARLIEVRGNSKKNP